MQSRQAGTSPGRVRVGGWLVERDECRLTRGPDRLQVRPLLVDLLLLLAGRPGEVVTKDAILERLWGGRFVSESVLTRTMAELRRVLGDTARDSLVIETVPKRGYRLVAPVETCPTNEPPRIAVLVFENLNRDPEMDFFAEGMSDALITELGRISSLRVISRQSVLRMRGTTRSLSDIARELRVEAVVEGSAIHAGDRVRITAQLVQADPEEHLWAESFDCAVSDVLDVQARLARTIASSIQAVLSPGDLTRLSESRPVNPEAHLAYLKARYHAARWTSDGAGKALGYLQEAMQHDPAYAPAHALLADTLGIMGFWGFLPTAVAYPQAKTAAETAVRLDESCSQAHETLGFLKWHQDWDLDGSERELLRAIELNPSNASARMSYAMFLRIARRERERPLAEARHALELDPLSLEMNFGFGWFLVFLGDYDGAVRQAKATIEMYPGALQPYYVEGYARLCQLRLPDATAAFEKAVSLFRDPYSLACLAYSYGRSGREADARAILHELTARREAGYVPNYAFFVVHSGLGDRDRAMAWLERCANARDVNLFWNGLLPEFELVAQDPRFLAMVERLGLPTEA